MKKAIRVFAAVLAVILTVGYSSVSFAETVYSGDTMTIEEDQEIEYLDVCGTCIISAAVTTYMVAISGTVVITSEGSLTVRDDIDAMFFGSEDGQLFLDYGSSLEMSGSIGGADGTVWYEVSNDAGVTISCEEGSYTTYNGKTYVKEGTEVTVSDFNSCNVLSVCGDSEVELNGSSFTMPASPVILSLTHGTELTETKKVDATCTSEGCGAYYYCTVCEKIFADEKAEEETSLDDLVIAKLDHSYSNGVCTVCGYGTSTTTTTSTTTPSTTTTTTTTSTTTEQVAESSPKTGEGSYMYLLLSAAFISLAGMQVARKRSF